MKVLLSWLREFAPDIDGDPTELGETLSSLGLAVEEMTQVGGGVDGVILARVNSLNAHPNADKIQIVQVDVGDGQDTQVCCGAFNMAVGDLIPFATVGTTMPNGMEIAQRKMRGEMSNGMCCAAEEIGLSSTDDGIMILTGRASLEQVGDPLADVLGLEEDVLWDLEVNANRPDAMSVAGVARDLAAALGVDFSFPDYQRPATGDSIDETASVTIVDPSLCGRFAVRIIDGVEVGESPEWMQRRLLALGMRLINSVVDISNYVMLELGQPNHTYDLDLVPQGSLHVRRARTDERLETLDGVERELTANDGVIANADDIAVGLAGVMGGASTEISASTTSVLLEMAWWDPPSVSRTVKSLNLPSEASTRFRRGVDWGENIDRALDRFCQLITESGATVRSGQIDVRGELPDVAAQPVRVNKVNQMLGTELLATEVAAILTSIGFENERVPNRDDDVLSVQVPTWRWDALASDSLEFEANIAEEVGRIFGYERIEKTQLTGGQAGSLTPEQKLRRLVRATLIGLGSNETQPMPFLAPGDLSRVGLEDDGVRLSNPLDASESVLRTSLLPGQLKAIAYNQSHRVEDIGLFEIGTVFMPPPDGQLLPDEHEMLAVAIAGADAGEGVRVLRLLAEVLGLPNLVLSNSDSLPGMHPTRGAEVRSAGKVRGVVGEVAPRVLDSYDVEGRVAWIEIDLGASIRGPLSNSKYRPVSKFPSSDMDLAFVISESIEAQRVTNTMAKAGGELLVDLDLVDVYRGEGLPSGSRSLTYRLRIQARDRTLADADISGVREAVIAAVKKHHDGELRQ